MIPVLFTTYNRLAYTRQALDALMANTEEPFRLFVVDNGSDDGTRQFLKQYPWREQDEVHYPDKNLGIAGTMNYFFQHCGTEEFLAKVDNDSVVPKGWLGKLLRAAKEHNLDVVGAKHFFNIPEYKDWDTLVAHSTPIDTPDGRVIPHAWVGGSGVLFRTAFLKHGPIPENMGVMGGWTQYQDHFGKVGKTAFHEGVELKLLDMADHNKFNDDYPEYNRKIRAVRMLRTRQRLRVAYFLGEVDGVDWYRAQQVGQSMERSGIADVMYVRWNDREDRMGDVLAWSDIIVWRWPTIDIIKWRLQMAEVGLASKAHIIDFEDNFFDVSPFNSAYRYFGTREVSVSRNGGIQALWQHGVSEFDIDRNIKQVRQLSDNLRNAAAITVCSEGLAEIYKGHGLDRSWVIPDTVDPDNFPILPLKPHEGIRIGWHGGASHYEDMAKFMPIIKGVMERHPEVTFVVYGTSFPALTSQLPPDRVELHGWTHVRAHGYKLSSLDLDLAVVPLAENQFAKGKSSLKWKESSVLGVPVVAQNFGPYARDIVHGKTGLLVSTDDEWETAIRQLIEDADLRHSIGQAAREEVLAKHNAREWGLKTWSIYREIMETQGVKERVA